MLRALFSALVCIGLLATPVAAQDIAPVKVGVIEMQAIEGQSVAWKDLRAKYEAEKDKMLQDLSAIQSGLEQEGQDLQQQRAILAPEAFETKRASFEQRLREENQSAVQRRQALDQAWLQGRNTIIAEVRNIVLEIAEEKGLNLILDQSSADPTIVLAGAEIKITDAVVQRLDAKIKTVAFTIAPIQ